MKDRNDILGQTITQKGAEAIRLLERSISEGFLSGQSAPNTSAKNIFGRSVYEEKGSDLSFLAGLAASGLRCGAFLSGPELGANHNQLRELIRQHLPVVVHYSDSPENGKIHDPVSALKTAGAGGCFQFTATDLQQALDLSLIAHKVAERSLIPGICAMDGKDIAWKENQAEIPTADQLRRFLGDPDSHIPTPTPAQEILFGKDRRPVPHWFNLDTPILNGMSKDPLAIDLEGAAQNRFFYHHLSQIIEEVKDEYEEICGRKVSTIQTSQIEKADYLILTAGSIFPQVKEVVELIRAQEKLKIACLNLTVLRPFPEKQLAAVLKGFKAVTILENINGYELETAPLFREVKASVQSLGKQAPSLLSALHGHALSKDTLAGLIKNMVQKKEQRDLVFLDIDFTRDTSSMPQHELLLQSIRRAYPDITSETINTVQQSTRPSPDRVYHLPFSIQKYKDEGPAYTQLSRFYQHTACFYQSSRTVDLVADPFQALPLAPAATAGFTPVADNRTSLPVFNPQNCTACGACFTYCPHSAIPPLAIGMESLLRGAMNIAAQQGTPVTGLTPMVKNLAKVAAGLLKENPAIGNINDFLPTAFQKLAEQMKLSGERLEKAQGEVDILCGCVGSFPVAVTEAFFDRPEKMQKGSGELFSLAIDPVSCTGCGWCVEMCEDEALTMMPAEKELEVQLLDTQKIWEQLPDTSSDTIQRMIHQEDYDPFAATLLSRNFYLSTTGGATTEEGTTSKTMMHLLTAVTESVVQSRTAEQIRQIQQLIKDLSDNIHHHLSDALPQDDFRLVVEELKESKVPLDAVIRNLQSEGQPKMIDTPSLKRKIALLNDLKALGWELREGPTGGGRARYGLTMAGAQQFNWAEAYPYNPFTAPVIWHREGAAPEKLKGLMLGWRRHLIDNIRLMRRAQLEIKDKYRPEVHNQEIGRLSWEQLEQEEKELLNPLFLVGDQQLLSQANSNGLLDLLLLDMPVKIVVLDTADEVSTAALSRANTALFAAMSLRHAPIVRDSLANRQVLFEGLRDGIHALKPALFHILSPEKEAFFNEKRNGKHLSNLAMQTRAFTSFRYDPDIASGYLASDIRIAANPASDQHWVTDGLIYLEGEEEKTVEYTWTYADWLFAQKAWREYFRKPDAGEVTVLMAEFLALNASERKGKVAVIFSLNEERQLETYVADPEVVNAAQNALRQWNGLREIAGALTPFPEKLHQEVTQTLKAKYEQSMAELKAAYEEKLRVQEQSMMEEVKQKLRDKLLALSKQGNPHRN